MKPITQREAQALVLAEAIQALGEVPSGELYAHVMSYMTLETYDACIAMLEHSRMVRRRSHLLTWVGPVKES